MGNLLKSDLLESNLITDIDIHKPMGVELSSSGIQFRVFSRPILRLVRLYPDFFS